VLVPDVFNVDKWYQGKNHAQTHLMSVSNWCICLVLLKNIPFFKALPIQKTVLPNILGIRLLHK